MDAECSNASLGSISTSPREVDRDRTATLVYQLATVLAILLFLISF
jgi:hypothetical protein